MNSIKKNYFYNSIYQILNILLPLITAPYVARVLGAKNVGIYSYTYSIANYFVIFSMLGIANYGSRSCAKARNRKDILSKTFFSIYALQTSIGGILSIVYVIASLFVFKNLYFVYQIPLVLSGFLDISWFFTAIENFKVIIKRNIAVRVISAFLVFGLVKNSNDLWVYILILSTGTMIGQLLLWIEVRKYVFFYYPTYKDIKPHIIPNLTLFLPVIAVNIYKYMDKIMLGSMSMVEQAGFYEYAEKLTVLPLGLINSLGNVMLPRMSNLLVSHDETEAKRLMVNSMHFVIFLSSAMCFGLCGIAEKLVPFLFGEEYIPSILILYCLAPSMIFVSWANVIRTQYLIPREMDREYIISVFSGAGLNLIVNLLLIPSYGGVGAAMGTLAAEFLVCLVQSFMVWKTMELDVLFKKVYPYVVISVAMCFVVVFIGKFSNNNLILIVQIGVGILMECIMAALYAKKNGVINVEQFKIIAEKITKKNR